MNMQINSLNFEDYFHEQHESSKIMHLQDTQNIKAWLEMWLIKPEDISEKLMSIFRQGVELWVIDNTLEKFKQEYIEII